MQYLGKETPNESEKPSIAEPGRPSIQLK